jgi:hypothetical protein
MIEIKDLLLKFNDLLLGEDFKKESIRQVLFEVLTLDLKPKDIKLKNNTIFLNIKPIYKNEILIKKELIELKLKEIFGEKHPKEFR